MIKTYKEALDKIFTIENTEDYSLKKMKKAIKLLNDPLKNIKVVHITGTNWKGSVSKMIFSILKSANKQVWVFTSPHLIDIRERFLIDSWEITKEEFVDFLNQILDLNLDLSYFEKCVLIAILFFQKRKVEYAIFEVWLWWKLDATNIVNPVITCITSIGLDHMNILWCTIDRISFEKAWIIKNNIPLIINHRNKVIEEVAKSKNAPVIFTNKKIETNLLWDFQQENAWLAYEIAKFLEIDEKNILLWLQKVEHIWRLQFLETNLLIDWAHNIDSIKKLKEYVNKNLKKKFEKIFYCFSLKKWKNINMVIDIIWKEENYILIDIKKDILEDITKYKNDFVIKTKDEVLILQRQNPQNLYIVFGSLYMIWEFLK